MDHRLTYCHNDHLSEGCPFHGRSHRSPSAAFRPVFLTDAGLQTDLIFNHGVEIREFAAHTLLPIPADREKMAAYFRGYLRLAQELGTGYILDAPTWKIDPHWAADLGRTKPRSAGRITRRSPSSPACATSSPTPRDRSSSTR